MSGSQSCAMPAGEYEKNVEERFLASGRLRCQIVLEVVAVEHNGQSTWRKCDLRVQPRSRKASRWYKASCMHLTVTVWAVLELLPAPWHAHHSHAATRTARAALMRILLEPMHGLMLLYLCCAKTVCFCR